MQLVHSNHSSPEAPAEVIPIVKKAGLVIVLGGRYVVLVRPHSASTAVWVLPKGHVEEGESAESCAVREALEETGCTVAPVGEADIITTTSRKVVTLNDAGEVTKEEIEEVRWFLGRAVVLKTESITDVVLENDILRPRAIGIFPINIALARLTFEEQREVLALVLAS